MNRSLPPHKVPLTKLTKTTLMRKLTLLKAIRLTSSSHLLSKHYHNLYPEVPLERRFLTNHGPLQE